MIESDIKTITLNVLKLFVPTCFVNFFSTKFEKEKLCSLNLVILLCTT